MSSVRDRVQARYARLAVEATAGDGCCDDGCCTDGGADAGDFGTARYDADELAPLPVGAAVASLGCGNPTAVADLAPGEVVLDLGSGAGLDVFLSARRVGPEGFVYGIDMTDEMLALARRNQEEAGIDNVEFRRGYLEELPLDAASVDVVISNCVINLSADKPSVFAEISRVLRPGGRIGIADIVAEDHLTAEERAERGSWVGCIAGALSFTEYDGELREAGFEHVEIEATHSVADGMHSAIIRARKPSTEI
jgi:SAM-dependent methyltransferase